MTKLLELKSLFSKFVEPINLREPIEGDYCFFFFLRNVYVGSSLAREVMIKKPGTDDLGKALLAEVIRSYLTADARRIPAIRNSEDSSARVFSFESLAVIQ